MKKAELIDQIMELVDGWESTEKSEFIREDLLPYIPVQVLKAILVHQQDGPQEKKED
jgi:hypothetical protein